MPKKNVDEDKKKELEKLIAEIKDNAPETSKGEIEELEKMLATILEEDEKPLGRKILSQVVSFSIHAVVMYIVALLAFGFFLSEVIIANKFLLFLIALVISLVLVTFERIPRNPFRKHFIKINLMLFAVIVMAFCIMNNDLYQVFEFSIVWLFYIATVEILYFLIEYVLLKKIRFA